MFRLDATWELDSLEKALCSSIAGGRSQLPEELSATFHPARYPPPWLLTLSMFLEVLRQATHLPLTGKPQMFT